MIATDSGDLWWHVSRVRDDPRGWVFQRVRVLEWTRDDAVVIALEDGHLSTQMPTSVRLRELRFTDVPPQYRDS